MLIGSDLGVSVRERRIRRYVQPTNKGVNHAANMILRNQLIQRHRKQRPLTPTFSLNESHEKCPRSREGIFSFVYRPAQCFVTVWVTAGLLFLATTLGRHDFIPCR